MPAIDDSGRNFLPRRKPPRKKPPTYNERVRANQVAGPAAPKPQPKPQPKPASVFRPQTGAPFARQQQEAQQRVDQARRKLPTPVIAAPPVIRNPTPQQSHAARAQIVQSIRVNLGDSRGADRQARQAALYHEIATNPRLARAKRSIQHYAATERALTAPQTRDTVKAGPKPTEIKAGFLPAVDLSAVRRALPTALPAQLAAMAPGLQGNRPGAAVVRNLFGDVGALGEAPFVGGYQIGRALALDATSQLRGRPAVETGAESTKLGSAMAKGAWQEITHPLRSLHDHPLLTALDAAGAVSALGRVAGAGARAAGSTVEAGGVRGGLARAGSTVRPPLALTEDVAGGLVARRYSKDLSRKAVQVMQDRLRRPLENPDGSPVMRRDGGRSVPVLAPKSALGRAHLANRRGDMVAGRTNAGERLIRERESAARTVSTRAGGAARNALGPRLAAYDGPVHGVSGRRARDMVAAATEGTITSARHMEEDLRARVKRLDREYAARIDSKGFRHSGEARTNRANRRAAQKILGNPKQMAQAKAIVAEAERHGRAMRASDAEKARLGIEPAARLDRAALEAPALEHMGARYFTVAEHKRLEHDAAQAETAAREAYKAATSPAARDAALKDLAAARDHRISVSGRDPAGVRVHEVARTAHDAAQARLKALRVHEAKAKARVRDLAVTHRSERGREAHHGPVARYEVNGKRFTLRQQAEAYAKTHKVQAPAAQDRPYHEARLGIERRIVDQAAKKLADPNLNRIDRLKAQRDHDISSAAVKQHASALASAPHAKVAAVRAPSIKRIALTPGEAKRVGALDQALRAFNAAKKDRRAAEGTARTARDAAAKAPMPDAHAALRYGEDSARLGKKPGEHLPNKDIEDFLRSRGRDPGTVAYLPHRGDTIGKRAYHKELRVGSRPGPSAGVRTGSAYIKGAVRSTAKLIRDQGVHQRIQIANANAIDRTLSEHTMRHPAWNKAKRGEPLNKYEQRVVDKGGLYTAKEALDVAERLMHDNGEYLVPVRMHAAALSEDVRQVIRENHQGPGGMDSLGQRMLNDRIVTEGAIGDTGTRNVGLMSGDLFDRLDKHLRPAGAFLKAMQVMNRAFRFAVLPQPRWLAGNFIEPYGVRLTVKGSGVNVFGLGLDIAKSRSMFKRMKASGDPKLRAAAAELEAQGLGGLLFGNRSLSNRRALEDFPVLDRTAQAAYGRIVAKLPFVESFGDITKTLLGVGAKMVMAPLKLIFAMNRGIERGAQHAVVGGFVRDEIQSFTGSWWRTIKTGEEAWRELQQGMVDTPTQHRLLDEANDVLGKYGNFSPTMRAIVQGPAPFLPWMLNAVRFVYWTMPGKHTVLNTVLIKAEQAVEKDWRELHAGTPPGSLRDAVPNGKGGWIDLARYAPYGATVPVAQGDLRGLTSQYLPQIAGATSAIEGRDPFGKPLKVEPTPANPKGTPSGLDKVKIALNALAEAHVIYLSTGRRLQEHGNTAYADSTALHPRTKPGTSHGMSAARRVFDPFRPTYLGAGGASPSPAGAARPAGAASPDDAALERALNRIDAADSSQAATDAALERALSRIP